MAAGMARAEAWRAETVPWTLPDGAPLGEVAGLACDGDDLYVFNRGAHPMAVFDRAGRCLRAWGHGRFARPHGVTVAPDGTVWCVDQVGHVVHRFTRDGRLLQTIGGDGPSASGYDGTPRSIRRGAGPFNHPTNLPLAPDGTLLVSDGYGNARVHRFAADGRLLRSWGAPGNGPGEFDLPHGVAVDRDGVVYVCDRENSRVQTFTLDGRFLAASADVARPMQVCVDGERVYVAEVGWHAALYSARRADAEAPRARISVFDRRGRLLARWSDGVVAPHAICVDARGDVYVGEVTAWAGGDAARPERPVLRAYRREERS